MDSGSRLYFQIFNVAGISAQHQPGSLELRFFNAKYPKTDARLAVISGIFALAYLCFFLTIASLLFKTSNETTNGTVKFHILIKLLKKRAFKDHKSENSPTFHNPIQQNLFVCDAGKCGFKMPWGLVC